MWSNIPFATLSSVLRGRNDEIFRGEASSVDSIILVVVVLRMTKWLLVRKEFDNVKIEDIIHN